MMYAFLLNLAQRASTRCSRSPRQSAECLHLADLTRLRVRVLLADRLQLGLLRGLVVPVQRLHALLQLFL